MKDITDVGYLPETRTVAVTGRLGFPTYMQLDSMRLVDANERALGTETVYESDDGLCLVFYPEDVLSEWYVDLDK